MLRVVDAQRDELLRAFLERHEAECPGCGYSLRGCVTEVCPECGAGLALTLTPRRADRRTLVLLALMLGWVLAEAGLETYFAQDRVRALAQPQAVSRVIRLNTLMSNRQTTVTLNASRITFGGASTVVVGAPLPRTPVWSAVPWLAWTRLGASAVCWLLALGGLVALVMCRSRAVWPPTLVKYAVAVFVVWAALFLAFRVM